MRKPSWTVHSLFFVAIFFVAGADAQPPGFGGGPGGFGGPGGGFRGRGGPPQGFGGSPGGFRGGPAPGGDRTSRGGDRASRGGDRGSRGGDRGGRGGDPGGDSNRAMEFLKRLDTNGNGQLDVDEMQGRAKFLIDRVAAQTGLNTSRAISLDKFAKSFEKMRNGGGEEVIIEDDGMLPGFDDFAAVDPLPGFGATDAIFANVTVEDRDTRTAEDRMRRYDRNKDNYLTREEISSGRWSDDPFQFDRNRDGRLSTAELAVRYAKRRIESAGGSVTGKRKAAPSFYTPSTSTASSSSGGGSRGGRDDGGDDRAKRYIDFMMSRYDRNRDGKIDRDEASGMRGDPKDYDKNGDGKIDRSEVESHVRSRFGGGDRSKGDKSDGKTNKPDSYRFTTLEEKLEEQGVLKTLERNGFLETDRDRDGQIRMAEYSTSWDDKTAEAFMAFDANNDGIITPEEFAGGIENGLIWGGNRDGGSSDDTRGGARVSSSASNDRGGRSSGGGFYRSGTSSSGGGFYRSRSSDDKDGRGSGDRDDRSSRTDDSSKTDPDSEDESEASRSSGESATDQAPSTRVAPEGDDGQKVNVPKAYVRYAVQLIQEHDVNKDQVLDKDEWSKMGKDPSKADTNGDGQITPQELAFFKFKGN